MVELYNRLKSKNEEKIVIIKRGNFYYVCYRDSYVINYLFDYKLVREGCCFSKLDKVCDKLSFLNIGYLVFDNGIIVNELGDSERYYYYFRLGYDKVKRDNIINSINDLLVLRDIDYLEELLGVIRNG